MEGVRVYAKWDNIERKVIYSASFTNVKTGRIEFVYGYISKTALYEAMKFAGATSQQIKEARAFAKKIKTFAYRR